MALTVTFDVLSTVFLLPWTAKQPRWTGALWAAFPYRRSSLADAGASPTWTAADTEAEERHAPARRHADLHLLAWPLALWSLTPAIADSHTWAREQEGWHIARKNAAASATHRIKLSSAVLPQWRGSSYGLLCLVLIFPTEDFLLADGRGEVQTWFCRGDIRQQRCLDSLCVGCEGVCVCGVGGNIFALLRCLRWILFSAMPGMCPPSH